MKKKDTPVNPNENQQRRIEAVEAILAGRSQSDVAREFDVSRQAVFQWVQTYKKKGPGGLVAQRGRPRIERLPAEYEEIVREIVLTQTPQEAGLETDQEHWDLELGRQIIDARAKVKYTYRVVAEYFEEWGIEYGTIPVKHRRPGATNIGAKKAARRGRPRKDGAISVSTTGHPDYEAGIVAARKKLKPVGPKGKKVTPSSANKKKQRKAKANARKKQRRK